jgi:hypothetical protein
VRRRTIISEALVLLQATLFVTGASAASLVVGLPGTANNVFPFGGGYATGGAVSTRYQQAYAADDFSAAGGIMLITSVDFLSGGGKLAPSTYSLYFSTITSDIDSLSNVNFDSNRGADNTLFAALTLAGTAPPTLTFSGAPFFYNPAHGNLLLDIVVSPGGVDANAGFGANYMASSTALGIFSRYHNFGSGNSGWGLVTQFDYQPVPEPSQIALICVALLLAGTSRRWVLFPSKN